MPVSDLESLVDVDFDPVDKFIYWSEKAVIKRSTMDGTGMYVVFCQIFGVVRIYTMSSMIRKNVSGKLNSLERSSLS